MGDPVTPTKLRLYASHPDGTLVSAPVGGSGLEAAFWTVWEEMGARSVVCLWWCEEADR